MTTPVLGCIADDFTGATDLANNLVRSGMKVVQAIGVPDAAPGDAVDAIVIALKTRTAARSQAVEQSLAALRWLRSQNVQQIYFKICSTFDSTPAGNIGPVAEALMDALGSDLSIVTPAFPDNERTVFKGYLFVGDVLLSESSMRHHPLTPMTDANLVRVMQGQCRRRVGLIDRRVVALGADAVRARMDELRGEGVSFAVVDAIDNEDLVRMAPAFQRLSLVTAGSGLAIALPRNWGFKPNSEADSLPAAGGLRAIVCGSCSQASNAQVRAFIDAGGAAFAVDPLLIAKGADVVGQALDWSQLRLAQEPVLVYSTAEPQAVEAVHAALGPARAGEVVEAALASIARGLVERGVRQLVVAGGETSGACIQALGIREMRIGPQIDPGVPWCHAGSPVAPDGGLHLALKSGNFGGVDFFTRAFELLQ